MIALGAVKLHSQQEESFIEQQENLLTQQSFKRKKFWVIDATIARVNGSHILKSHLEQPQISKDGATYSLKEAVFEELLFQEAGKKHLMPKASDVERQIVGVKIQGELSHLTDAQFDEYLQETHKISLAIYKNQITRLLAIENIKREEIKNKMIATTQEVEEYDRQNPVYEPEKLRIMTTKIADNDITNYRELVENNKLEWLDRGWIEKNDIDSAFISVTKLQKGEISEPIESKGSYHLFKVVDKREAQKTPLKDRYISIEKILLSKKEEELTQKLERRLFDKAHIIYFKESSTR